MCCLALLKHSQIKYKITYQQRERRELANNNQGKGGRIAYGLGAEEPPPLLSYYSIPYK
jgi:hypothetical protein